MEIFARDIIAAVVLTFCFIAMFLHVDTVIPPIITLIVGYYFSKRVYEEENK